MRVKKQEMDSGHDRIVRGAARLMRERGIRGTSVADSMNEAQMTHGGFYRHFGSKDELMVEALRAAFDEFAMPLEQLRPAEKPKDAVADYKTRYLSETHIANAGIGCPMPALGSDLARESQALKREFTSGLQRIIAALARAKRGSDTQRREAALREMAMMVGAVLIARATVPETAREVLTACRN